MQIAAALSVHRTPAKLRRDHPHFSEGEAEAREASWKIVLSARFAPSTSLHHSSHHIKTSDVTASAWNVETTLGSCGNGLGSLDRFPSPSTTTASKTIRHGFQTFAGPS